MKKSEKSIAELQIEEAINHMNVMLSKNHVTDADARYLVKCAIKVQMKCEELRLSRDNHAEVSLKLKQEIKELKEKLKDATS